MHKTLPPAAALTWWHENGTTGAAGFNRSTLGGSACSLTAGVSQALDYTLPKYTFRANIATVEGEMNVVTVPTTGGSRFYRLSQ